LSVFGERTMPFRTANYLVECWVVSSA